MSCVMVIGGLACSTVATSLPSESDSTANRQLSRDCDGGDAHACDDLGSQASKLKLKAWRAKYWRQACELDLGIACLKFMESSPTEIKLVAPMLHRLCERDEEPGAGLGGRLAVHACSNLVRAAREGGLALDPAETTRLAKRVCELDAEMCVNYATWPPPSLGGLSFGSRVEDLNQTCAALDGEMLALQEGAGYRAHHCRLPSASVYSLISAGSSIVGIAEWRAAIDPDALLGELVTERCRILGPPTAGDCSTRASCADTNRVWMWVDGRVLTITCVTGGVAIGLWRDAAALLHSAP